MTWWVATYLLLTVLLCASLWLSAPIRTWRVVSACSVFAVFVLSFGMAEGLGNAKPIRLEWREPQKVSMLAHKFVEGKAIYVWLAIPGNDAPVAYVLPWSLDMAKDIRRAEREGRGQRGVVVEDLFRHSWENRKPKVFAAPQPAMPPKNYGPDGT